MDPERWSRIEELYHQAAALDTAARAIFLTRACGDDRALLEEIESLLGEDGAGDPFLDEPALAVAARLVAGDIPVLTGRTFGPYRLEALLGAGAMGDVYRAHDTVLGREVAIKLLPEAFNDDPERLARFRQEAQFLASLSHPNIAAIYGVHESEGMHGLVLELADGETLAERIRRGPIPLHDAARIARQIGEGLDAAHQRGIVHRDLKPSNITIARDGTTKILDFGLAKSSVGEPDGLVIGTASYMSPEQARGDPVDKRTDIWAFGCVCFEMLTGLPAFRAEHRVGAALEVQPRWSVMPPGVPPSVTALLKRCLNEDQTRRRRDIGDVLVDLDGALSQRVEPQPGRPLSTWLMMSGVVVLVLAAAMLPKAWRSTENPATVPEPRLSMLSLLLPPGMDFPEQDNQIAVSPDGTTIAYVAAPVGGAPRLVLKKLDADSEQIVGDAISVRDPFFSPDGRWIAFFAGDTLRKMSIADGQSRVICPARRGESGSWGRGLIVFGEPGDLPTAGIRRVSDDGGPVEIVSSPDRRVGERAHQAPQMLPDGRTVMYTLKVQDSAGLASRIVVQTPGKPPKVLLDDASYARYVGNSVLVYQRGHSLYATQVDLESLTTTMGPGVMLFDDLSPSDRPFWSAGGGVLVYRPRNGNRRFVWVDRHGTEISLPSPLKPYRAPNLSPRDDRIAVDIVEDGKTDVWMLDIERQALTRFTTDGWSSYPMWTPDGAHVGLSRRREDTSDLYWQSSDGSGSRELVRGRFRTWIGSWSPNMRTLIYMQENPATHCDLWAVDLQTKLSRPIVQTTAREYGGRLSADGRWLAYFSDEISPAEFELYVTAVAPDAPRHRISTGGAREAVWAKDGRELFYRHGSQLLSVRIPSDGAFSPGRAQVLFEGEYFSMGGPGIVNYDVSSDGQRFLMLKPIEDRAPQLKVVQGLDRLIRERLPQNGR